MNSMNRVAGLMDQVMKLESTLYIIVSILKKKYHLEFFFKSNYFFKLSFELSFNSLN